MNIFATRLRVILSKVPPGPTYASLGAASQFDSTRRRRVSLRVTRFVYGEAGRRGEVEIRPSGGSNATWRVWNLAKNPLYHVTEPYFSVFQRLDDLIQGTSRLGFGHALTDQIALAHLAAQANGQRTAQQILGIVSVQHHQRKFVFKA